MLDIRQTTQYGNYLKKIGWIVERTGGTNYFVKKFPIIGSLIKIQRPREINLYTISEMAKKYRAFQIIIEPDLSTNYRVLISAGFKLSNSPYLPPKTLQLDLTKSENQLLKVTKKDARLAIQKNRELKIKNCEIKDLEKFVKSWENAAGWKHYVPPPSHLIALNKSFKQNCLFITASLPQQSGLVTGAVFLIGDKIGYYWQAFTSKQGRKLQSQYKIVWEGILWAKKNGAKVFDFEGIYDERFPNKSWLGFTHFKKSFGGHEIEYPGAFVKNLLLPAFR